MPAVNMAEIHFRRLSAAQVDDHQPAAMRQQFDFPWKIVAANDVDDDIDAATAWFGAWQISTKSSSR